VNSNKTITALTAGGHKPATARDDRSSSKIIPPFAATCRAEAIAGNKQYSRCLVNADTICWYRTSPFNFGPLCLHPHHLEIVTRTDGQMIV
jgi:hypothetical protein